MPMTTERREELDELFANSVVEGMDLKTLKMYAYDSIHDGLRDCGDQEFLENIAVNHDHLLSPSELLESGANHATD